ncbi:unnamed protein product [Rotaria sp. Silwood2]|nr:unnamed protein product [Rotaria sp. Silwood2]
MDESRRSLFKRKEKRKVKGLCECTDSLLFGKNCEYFLPEGTTSEEIIAWEVQMKTIDSWQMQLFGDSVCYTTLSCNTGLLCLDWRDICDGVQQCMSGDDETNCDKLEFNDCDDDEYRCMNGMCIPDEYFLDGDYDCSDLSDEKQVFNDMKCTLQKASVQCDDQMCSLDEWSCGDGQCITDRIAFQDSGRNKTAKECNNLRDQYYMCEMNPRRRQ